MAGLLDFGGAAPSGGGGLLDFITSDPGARMGLTMLASSSPRFGGGILQALQSQEEMKKNALQQQYIQSQIAENTSQAKMRDQQLALAQQKQNMLSSIFGGPAALAGVTTGGGFSTPAASGGSAGGGGATGGPGVENLTLNQVAALKANGMDVSELWKFSKEGIKRDAGNYYEDLNGNTKYMPKLDNGMMVAGGQVMAAPGYAQANSLIKGSEAGAVEHAKFPYAVGLENAKANIGSANDLVTLNLPSGPLQVTRAQALAMTQPQQPQSPQIGGGQNLTPQLRELIAQDAAANGIQNPTTNFQGAGRGQAYGVTNAPARGFGIPLQPKSAEEFSNNVAKADAEQLNAWRTAAENANSALSTVENLRDAVNKGVYSGGGAQAKTAAASIINGLTGAKPKGFVGSELFNANASALVLDRIKSLGANPSNADRDFIERTIPNLDKSAEARDALINFMEQKARGSIDLYKRADAHARQNNGLAGFDQFAKPEQPPAANGGGWKILGVK